MRETDKSRMQTSAPSDPPDDQRPHFDPEEILRLMYAKAPALRAAAARYKAASVVSQELLDFEISV